MPYPILDTKDWKPLERFEWDALRRQWIASLVPRVFIYFICTLAHDQWDFF